MGSTFVPSVGNLFMADLEEKFFFNENQNPFFKSISIFNRYIDDYFCVYTDANTVQAFILWLNALHPSIKFTSDGNVSQVNFLNTTVYRTTRHTLAVKRYVKPTDMNIYLHFKSLYSRHLCTNIP